MEESQELSEEGQVTEEGSLSTEAIQAGRIAELEAQLAQARQEAAENWNKYVRERAEMETFRKRQERLAGDRVQREKKALIHKLSGVMGNAERGLADPDPRDP